jgi:hypothetical protein
MGFWMQGSTRHSRGGVAAANREQDRPPLSGVGELGVLGTQGRDVVPRPRSPASDVFPPLPPGIIFAGDGPPSVPGDDRSDTFYPFGEPSSGVIRLTTRCSPSGKS